MEAKVISYHCWNKDGTKIAIVPNNNIVEIYNVKGFNPKDWTLDAKFKPEHGSLITCVDWSAANNMILTCSQDRNAYVWSPPDGENSEWTPQIVLLRFNRAATCCAWSPDGSKFIVGGSERSIMICYYDKKNNFWVAKKINRHRSSILSLAWHPSGVIMGSSGCDSSAVVGAALQTKAGDSKDTTIDIFGSIRDCASGSVYDKERVPGSWVSSIAFSPSGSTIALCSRNSTVRFVKFTGINEEKTAAEIEAIKAKREGDGKTDKAQPKVMETESFTLLLRTLPFTCGLFVDETTFVAAGFDPQPTVIKQKGSNFEWAVDRTLEMEAAGGDTAPKSGALSAMRRFQERTQVGGSSGSSSEEVKGHTNSTSAMKVAKVDASGKPTYISTSGLDGKLLFWKL